ncbi:endonuclease domain-containing protein [Nitratireductor sp. ZSWI3]|uniref:endonuclease domain-containing protein n=1 Tax=Nitratireductor sp. ZSWI3 TaxID=2966359 RepID=UPI0021502DCF|nr:endonuclease domain-containing protein [Nitratireductor sp. ZSWI3]MCR4266605.1 endonuclease domain-containing protein [Nitratireductor sp. ZSWI3]
MRNADRHKTGKARSLRQADNDAEEAMWSELRNRRLNGYKFVRQLPVGPYFADFACRERRLVVEVDGSQHAGSYADRHRDSFMNERGWSVLRFWNVDVLKEREQVLETVLAVLDARLVDPVDTSEMRFVPSSSNDEENMR